MENAIDATITIFDRSGTYRPVYHPTAASKLVTMVMVQHGTQCLEPRLTATAEPLLDLMRREEQQCAIISGYPDAVPPACSGQASICSFANLFLGCCDSSDFCTFHTTCYDYWDRASCTSACTVAGLVW